MDSLNQYPGGVGTVESGFLASNALVSGLFRFHHIGCAVESIEIALKYYTEVMGFVKVSETVEVASQNARVCFVAMDRGILLELVEGRGTGAPVDRLIEKNGGGPYHICYEVDDLDDAVVHLKKDGFHRLKRFTMDIDGGYRFAFMLTPDRQLLELCEKSE